MMRIRLRLLVPASVLAAAAFLAPAAPSALAGDNMPGKWHEDKLIGFRFRPLNEWAPVPAGTDPSDPKLCGFYSDAAKFDRTVKPECAVYAFKVQSEAGVPTPDEGGGGKDPTPEEQRAAFLAQLKQKSTKEVFDSVRSRYQENANAVLSSMEEKKRKKVLKDLEIGDPVEKKAKQGDLEITVVECTVPIALTNGRENFIRGWKMAAAWTSNDEYEVGVMYQIPEESWKKYRNGVLSSLTTIEFLTGADVAAARSDLADALAGKTGDARWLEEIKRKVTPGWAFLQTKNYLLVYDKNVKPDRVKLIAVQIEAIRKDVYEILFPSDRPVTAISVVRVCKDNDQYHQYGGPGGSAGYWNWVDQELVFYEDVSAKKDSLRVLNHEAFHQYIFYSVGNVSPHSWFNEGHGDYFSGHNFSPSGKFIPKPFEWRKGLAKSTIGSKQYVKLKEFVTYTQQQYYANGGPNYAQGWSVVWFLRQQKDPQWKGILEAYFNALKGEVTKWAQEQEEKARKDGEWKEGWVPGKAPDEIEVRACQKGLDAAFGGWDEKKWEKFEKAWKDFL